MSISPYNVTLDPQLNFHQTLNFSTGHLMYEREQYTFQLNNLRHLEWRLAI